MRFIEDINSHSWWNFDNHSDLVIETKKSTIDVLSWYYTKEEYLSKWWEIPWAIYLLENRPEILKEKKLLEEIRKTKRVRSITLEWEWSKWYVVQISDICIKFKNEYSDTNFKTELNNYKLIEEIYNNQYPDELKKYFKIPKLQRYLCDKDCIAMEYIDWNALSIEYILKEKNISIEDIKEFVEKNRLLFDDIDLIYKRLILDPILKDHEIRKILLYMWVDEYQIMNICVLDNQFVMEYCIKSESVNAYKKRKEIIRGNNILSIDDHCDNLRINSDGILYWLDFGNIIFNKKNINKWLKMKNE